MVSQWSLSDSKSPQDSRAFLSILNDLNNAVVWMISTCILISKSSSIFIKPLLRLIYSQFMITTNILIIIIIIYSLEFFRSV